jgi:hypothetical protein
VSELSRGVNLNPLLHLRSLKIPQKLPQISPSSDGWRTDGGPRGLCTPTLYAINLLILLGFYGTQNLAAAEGKKSVLNREDAAKASS